MHTYRAGARGGNVVSVATRDGVFAPTGTSDLLVASAASVIVEPKRVLDLGCGSGFVGIALAKSGCVAEPLCASDISAEAVALATENAQAAGVRYDARQGSLFTPWIGEHFEVVIDDVAGVADDIAALSDWCPSGVCCDAGRDGTRWILEVIATAPHHLTEGGTFIFPVLSLSNEQKILNTARRVFTALEVIGEQTWFLPDAIAMRTDVLQPLIEEGAVCCEQKFGTWLWTTRIYRAVYGRHVA